MWINVIRLEIRDPVCDGFDARISGNVLFEASSCRIFPIVFNIPYYTAVN